MYVLLPIVFPDRRKLKTKGDRTEDRNKGFFFSPMLRQIYAGDCQLIGDKTEHLNDKIVHFSPRQLHTNLSLRKVWFWHLTCPSLFQRMTLCYSDINSFDSTLLHNKYLILDGWVSAVDGLAVFAGGMLL